MDGVCDYNTGNSGFSQNIAWICHICIPHNANVHTVVYESFEKTDLISTSSDE